MEFILGCKRIQNFNTTQEKIIAALENSHLEIKVGDDVSFILFCCRALCLFFNRLFTRYRDLSKNVLVLHVRNAG